MGRSEGLIALGLSWQLLILTLLGADAFGSNRGLVAWLAIIGFIITAVGAWMTAWSKTIGQ